MAENTKIQWASHSWSPWRGCAKVSPGCANCYAEKLSHRNPAVLGEWGVGAKRIINADWKKPLAWDRKAAKLGERHRVFPSLCDPFEDREDLDATRLRFLDLIAATPHLDWLVLTKRPEAWRANMERVLGHHRETGEYLMGSCLAEHWLAGDPPPNVWLGVSAENQEYADKRLPHLMKIPAFVRWVSYEPALELVDFTRSISVRGEPGGYDTLNPMSGGMRGPREVCGGSSRRIDWIVCGGESGPGARRFDLEWGHFVRDQCRKAGVAFYMKQVGANPRMASDPYYPHRFIDPNITDPKGGDPSEWPEDLRVREFPAERRRAAAV